MPPALDLLSCTGNGWIATPDAWLRTAAFGAVLASAWWAATRRYFPGRTAFVAMHAALALWLLASGAERAATAPACRATLALLAWPAVLALAAAWSLFVSRYADGTWRHRTGVGRSGSTGSAAAAPAPAGVHRAGWVHGGVLVAASALIVTNGAHGLVYGPAVRSGAPRLPYEPGPLLWLAAAWAYTLLAASAWQLLQAMRRAHAAELRALWRTMFAVSLLPLAVNVAHLGFGVRLIGSDPTPFGFAAAALVFAWLISRQRLFALVPLARRLLFTELADPVLVLDREGRVLEANVAARQLSAAAPLPGTPLATWPRFGAALVRHLAAGDRTAPLALADPTASYEVHVREISAGERRIGTMVQLHEVTVREPVQAATATATATAAAPALAAADAASVDAAALQAFLREQANRDPLTGLLNRHALDERFPQEASYARSNGQTLAFVLLDVDHFKRINDEHGHTAGDAVLRDFSAALRTGLRTSDSVFRVGGEAFALLMPGADAPQAARRLQALRERLAGRKLGGVAEAVTFSAGVASTEDHGATLEELGAHADKALYLAKSQGRNRTVVAPAALTDDGLP